jgi:hypothetical protein
VVAAVYALMAVAGAAVAVTLLVAPDTFPLAGAAAAWRVFIAVLTLAFAVFLAVVCYDLLRLRDFARRAALILLALHALGRLLALLSALTGSSASAGRVAVQVALLAGAVAGAVYLSRPHVKRAFGLDRRPSSALVRGKGDC